MKYQEGKLHIKADVLFRRPYKTDYKHYNRTKQKELLQCKKSVIIQMGEKWSSPAIREEQLNNEDMYPYLDLCRMHLEGDFT